MASSFAKQTYEESGLDNFFSQNEASESDGNRFATSNSVSVEKVVTFNGKEIFSKKGKSDSFVDMISLSMDRNKRRIFLCCDNLARRLLVRRLLSRSLCAYEFLAFEKTQPLALQGASKQTLSGFRRNRIRSFCEESRTFYYVRRLIVQRSKIRPDNIRSRN